MQKLLANRFGLAISFIFLSLFPSTVAWAQKSTAGTATAQGPQQVVVTNTAAQSVPISGLVYVQNSAAQPIPVTIADKQLYQFSATVNVQGTTAYMHFTVPAGKKFVAQNINLFASTTDPACAFSAYGQDDAAAFSLALSKSAAPLGISTLWGGQNQVLFTAKVSLDIWFQTSGCTYGSASALVSGYII
jgi:hypothetical protein